jgi:hypothetical protein
MPAVRPKSGAAVMVVGLIVVIQPRVVLVMVVAMMPRDVEQGCVGDGDGADQERGRGECEEEVGDVVGDLVAGVLGVWGTRDWRRSGLLGLRAVGAWRPARLAAPGWTWMSTW